MPRARWLSPRLRWLSGGVLQRHQSSGWIWASTASCEAARSLGQPRRASANQAVGPRWRPATPGRALDIALDQRELLPPHEQRMHPHNRLPGGVDARAVRGALKLRDVHAGYVEAQQRERHRQHLDGQRQRRWQRHWLLGLASERHRSAAAASAVCPCHPRGEGPLLSGPRAQARPRPWARPCASSAGPWGGGWLLREPCPTYTFGHAAIPRTALSVSAPSAARPAPCSPGDPRPRRAEASPRTSS